MPAKIRRIRTGDAASTPPDPPDREADAVARAAQEIERLRSFRVYRGRDVTIRGVVEQTQSRALKVHRQIGALVDLWQTLLPAHVVEQTTLTALRGGVLHVTADSASVSYELDRLLRGGVLADLRNQFAGTLSRVKVSVGRAR